MSDEATKGRPTDYSEEMAAAICARIADGNSLRKVCAMPDMPGTTAVFVWLGKYPGFAEQYARACEDRREVRKEQLFDIPLDEDIDPQRARLLSDNIKWVLAKEAPKKYGDAMTLKGDKDNPLVAAAKDLTEAELLALANGAQGGR